MPRLSLLLLALLLIPTLSFAASVSAGAASMTGNVFVPAGTQVDSLAIPDGLTREEVREVVIVSIIARKYTLKEKAADHAVGYLNHRGHEATLTFLIGPGSVVMYCEGFAVKKNGARIKPETPAGWIQNLRNDIVKRMNVKLATK